MTIVNKLNRTLRFHYSFAIICLLALSLVDGRKNDKNEHHDDGHETGSNTERISPTTNPKSEWHPASEEDFFESLIQHVHGRIRDRQQKNSQNGNRSIQNTGNIDFSKYPPNIQAMMKKINDLFRKRGRLALKLYEAKHISKTNPQKKGTIQIATVEATDSKDNVPVEHAPVNNGGSIPKSNQEKYPSRPVPRYRTPSSAFEMWTGVGIGIGTASVVILFIILLVILFRNYRFSRCNELKELSFCNLTPKPESSYVKLSHLHKPKNSSRYIVTVLDESKISEDSDSIISSDEEELFDVSALKSNSPVVATGKTHSFTSTPKKTRRHSLN